jgi:hypothetical protein
MMLPVAAGQNVHEDHIRLYSTVAGTDGSAAGRSIPLVMTFHG